MRYQIEFIYKQKNCFRIHVSEKLVVITPEGGIEHYDFEDDGSKVVVQDGPARYVLDLLNTDGIEQVMLGQHHIDFEIGEVFRFNEVWPAIAWHLENTLCRDGKLEEAGEPFRIVLDENGEPKQETIGPKNHSSKPKK